jgi:putative acetyltransferase
MDQVFASKSHIELEHVRTANQATRELIGELNEELGALYSPEQRHGLDLDALFQPHIRFFVANKDGEAAGCGGVALFPDFGEIKRMYVRPKMRGRGIADTIMGRLCQEATASGLRLMRLETGISSLAAVSFYRRCGFEPCKAFEPYSSMPPQAIVTSVFLEKPL